jgi:hypothetical protein
LSVAPGFVQCIASLSERWHAKAKQKPTLMGVFGRYGSCYMWRGDGALAQVAKEEGSEPPESAGSRVRSR